MQLTLMKVVVLFDTILVLGVLLVGATFGLQSDLLASALECKRV